MLRRSLFLSALLLIACPGQGDDDDSSDDDDTAADDDDTTAADDDDTTAADDDDTGPGDDDDSGDDDDDTPPPFDEEPLAWLFGPGFAADDQQFELGVLAAEFNSFDSLDVDEPALADRTFTPPGLTSADVLVQTDHGLDPADAVGVGVIADAGQPPTDYLALAAITDRTSVTPDATTATRTVDSTDAGCWTAGTCSTLAAEDAITVSTSLGDATLTRQVELRALELSDGRFAIVERSWIAASGTASTGGALLQEYRLVFTIEDESTPRRLGVAWAAWDGGATDPQVADLHAQWFEDTFSAEDSWLQQNP